MWLARCLRPKFAHPISPSLRAAVLVPLFREGRRAVYWNERDAGRLARWKPQLLAGYFAQLVGCEVRPSHAVVVFTHPGQSFPAADRDQLWRRFRVPIFQQIVDERGRLIAYECEAHDAFHVVSAPAAGEIGTIRDGSCACGKPALLLVLDDRQRTLTVTRSESVCPPAPVATT